MKKPKQTPPRQEDRNDRLKAALKANIARRKAQADAKGTRVAGAPQAEKD